MPCRADTQNDKGVYIIRTLTASNSAAAYIRDGETFYTDTVQEAMDVISGEEDLADQIGTKELCRDLHRWIRQCLDEREARIIRLRYGLDGGEPLTQLETAQRCSISRSYVSRIEKRALEKLRSALDDGETPAAPEPHRGADSGAEGAKVGDRGSRKT